MERILEYIRVFPGAEAAYDARHAEVWPELVVEIQESGFRNYTGFRRGTDVWYYGECHPDADTALAALDPKPANTRWNHFFRCLIAEMTDSQGNPLRYDQVFHSDGAHLDGPMSRGCLSLVIDPDRAADYDALHANPWPEIVAALEVAGCRNLSGFRREAHVVYYGEFYPDIETVLGRMHETDVSRRWGAAFEGIIATITDPDGNLITAREMYHND